MSTASTHFAASGSAVPSATMSGFALGRISTRRPSPGGSEPEHTWRMRSREQCKRVAALARKPRGYWPYTGSGAAPSLRSKSSAQNGGLPGRSFVTGCVPPPERRSLRRIRCPSSIRRLFTHHLPKKNGATAHWCTRMVRIAVLILLSGGANQTDIYPVTELMIPLASASSNPTGSLHPARSPRHKKSLPSMRNEIPTVSSSILCNARHSPIL